MWLLDLTKMFGKGIIYGTVFTCFFDFLFAIMLPKAFYLIRLPFNSVYTEKSFK